ncbi:MAG: 2-succinyl-5-enolpyruvyl-6-hydroxy-3-cyclohexene-1-carboxylic-acid synthase [Candidatus Marinimicrobia bacterium]|nr:2-succinyl-5-enolpyruvyl-6-hydroxy-3-cyclohexene-1-carboxylic-acid synthase [Candidatus Neomarinimicrobiota bacterium]
MNTSILIKNTQHIYDLVGLCADFGVEKAVVCPGSRCAPLLIGFGKHQNIETISVTDERSAGFVGLGLAQQTENPVVLVCTSGTAAQNFAPAVIEAYYQNVPLFVLTADRPPEWIEQWDGQTIRQKNLYIEHIKGSFVYDEDTTGVGKKALELALEGALGPVHLNIPIREPFYPDSLEEVQLTSKTRRTQRKIINRVSEEIWNEFESVLASSEKVMVLGGQLEPNPELVNMLNLLDVPVVVDVISNIHGVENVIKSADLIFKTDDESLIPDFLITFGRSIISKNLKLYLRKNKPKVHWHIGEGMVGDPFQSLTKIIKTPPLQFFTDWLDMVIKINDQDDYCNLLKDTQKSVDEDFDLTLDNAEFNYFNAVRSVLKQLPQNSVLHLGNSMPVRIANFIGIKESTIDIWCNRGTSGIDGVVSTAVGHALAEPNRKHTLIIGDLSFFYDRNGLWLNHEFPTNLQIVILNDNGGGIFNMIPGPSNQDGLTNLFTTPHQRTAKLTAQEFKLTYRKITSLEEIDGWSSGILEIFTEMQNNMETFKRITTKARRKLN